MVSLGLLCKSEYTPGDYHGAVEHFRMQFDNVYITLNQIKTLKMQLNNDPYILKQSIVWKIFNRSSTFIDITYHLQLPRHLFEPEMVFTKGKLI